jgi:hypothetical protein
MNTGCDLYFLSAVSPFEKNTNVLFIWASDHPALFAVNEQASILVATLHY